MKRRVAVLCMLSFAAGVAATLAGEYAWLDWKIP
jgi:hypothetical protein